MSFGFQNYNFFDFNENFYLNIFTRKIERRLGTVYRNEYIHDIVKIQAFWSMHDIVCVKKI